MGGHAIKTVPLVRLEREEYKVIENKILESLKKAYPHGNFRIVKYYGDKADFGDLDIIYALPDDSMAHQLFHESVHLVFNEVFDYKKEIPSVKNGEVESFGVPIDKSGERFFQVDLIKSNLKEIDFTDFYFSYNDLGNLMGRITRFLGLKLGHKGLFYVFRPEDNNDYKFRDILITLDKNKAMSLLGFNPEKYTPEQMSSLQGVFDFILESDYMIKEIFLSDNQNHITRKRERKRQTYATFVDYLEQLDVTFNHSIEEKGELRKEIFNKLMEDPELDFNLQYKQTVVDYERKVLFNKRFNGQVVSEVTGLVGKELGEFIQAFRNHVTSMQSDNSSFNDKEVFEKYVISTTDEELRESIRSFKIK